MIPSSTAQEQLPGPLLPWVGRPRPFTHIHRTLAPQFNGTRVTVDPAALLDGRLPRRALWATIVDAALAGQLSLGNVQRPDVGIEDLSDICDIYRVRPGL